MATITSAQSGDFSDTATWVGGVVPTVGDIAVAATGHIIAIDVDVTVTQVDQAGTGKFTLGNGRTLTANVLARAGTFTSGGTVEVTATSGNTATIIGNVTAVQSGAAVICAIVITGTGTLDLFGNVAAMTGGNDIIQNSSAQIRTNTTCTINITGDLTMVGSGQFRRVLRIGSSSNAIVTITGNLTAGAGTDAQCIFAEGTSASVTVTGNVTAGGGTTAHGISTTGASASVTVTGDVTGGDGSIAHGILATGASATVTVTGDVTASTTGNGVSSTGISSFVDVVGTVTAAGTTSHGINSGATASGFGVRLAGDMIDAQTGAVAVNARFFRLVAGSSGITRYANDSNFPNGGLTNRVSPDNVTGMPAEANVRSGLTFGFASELEGTLAVPPSGSVALGVPVDNTLGVASLDAGNLADTLVDILVGITENNGTITVPYNRGTETFTRAAVIDGSRTVQLIPNE
jgi:hypothetical protein